MKIKTDEQVGIPMAKENNETNERDEILHAKKELQRLLEEGIAAMKSNTGRPADEVFEEIERKFGFGQSRQSE